MPQGGSLSVPPDGDPLLLGRCTPLAREPPRGPRATIEVARTVRAERSDHMAGEAKPHRAAVLTVSDLGARGEREDTAGPAVATMLQDAGFQLGDRVVVADEPDLIEERLIRWSEEGYALILTAGGTGLTARDRTPEATLRALDYRVPGMEEAMRAASTAVVPTAMLSRGMVGVRGRTLIVNLPGSERAARENLKVVLPVLGHACDQLAGRSVDVARGHEQLINQFKTDQL